MSRKKSKPKKQIKYRMAISSIGSTCWTALGHASSVLEAKGIGLRELVLRSQGKRARARYIITKITEEVVFDEEMG